MRFWQKSTESEDRFNRTILPHLDAAYNLARWLARNDDDAGDILQEASIRAFRALDNCVGDAKAWFLTIVRNTSYTYLSRKLASTTSAYFDEAELIEWDGPSPEQILLMRADQEMVTSLIEELPVEFREVVILRDIEDMSYQQIAEITGTPIGTVMSRLNRARHRLQQRLADRTLEERRLGL